MRTIIPFVENRVFDPETAHLLAAAFENAGKSLTASGDRFADRLKAAHSREVLAKRIIELAQRGERDSIRLCDDALVYLEEQSADGRRGVSAR
jgi:hypothetical protein